MILKISGMTCGHCIKTVEKALIKVPGVNEVKNFRLEDGTVQIVGTPDPLQLIAAVMDEGYTAEVV